MARLRPTHSVRAVALLAGAALALTGCGGDDEAAATKVPVVAAFAPLQEAAQRVGGDRVAVTNLTPVGGQPHDLQPSPDGLAALRRAKVVFTLGPAFQPAVTAAVSTLPASVQRADLLGGTGLLEPTAPIAGTGGRVDGRAQSGPDQHAWVAPARFITMVEGVRDALVRADPAGKAAYEARAAKYLEELRALDAEYGTALATCESPVILAAHPAFGYLAKAYGLRQAVVAGLSPAGRPDPTALAAIKAYAAKVDVDTLFFGGPVPPRLAKAITTRAGVEPQTLNPVEGLTQDQIDRGDDYVSLMRANLRLLVDGLRCTPGT